MLEKCGSRQTNWVNCFLFACVVCTFVAIDSSVASAQANRATQALRKPAVFLVVFEISLLFINNSLGLAAVVACAKMASKTKVDEERGLYFLGGAVGGLWSAYTWFGWPYVTTTYFGTLGHPIEESSFSFSRLALMLFFGFVGFVVTAVICVEVEGNQTPPNHS